MFPLLGRSGAGETLEWSSEIMSNVQGSSGTNKIRLVCMSVCLVLRMPIGGHFMWSLAVAGLGLGNFVTTAMLRLGHPFKKLRLIALSKIEMWGLHND
jgi:hypothetical protein